MIIGNDRQAAEFLIFQKLSPFSCQKSFTIGKTLNTYNWNRILGFVLFSLIWNVCKCLLGQVYFLLLKIIKVHLGTFRLGNPMKIILDIIIIFVITDP